MLEPQQMKQVGIVVLGLAFVLWCWRSTRHAEELLSPNPKQRRGKRFRRKNRSRTSSPTKRNSAALDSEEECETEEEDARESADAIDGVNSAAVAAPSRPTSPHAGMNDELRFVAQTSTDGTRVLKLESRSLADQGDSPSTRAFYEILGRYSDIVAEAEATSPPATETVPQPQPPTEAVLSRHNSLKRSSKNKKPLSSKRDPDSPFVSSPEAASQQSSSEEHEEEDVDEDDDLNHTTGSLPPPRTHHRPSLHHHGRRGRLSMNSSSRRYARSSAPSVQPPSARSSFHESRNMKNSPQGLALSPALSSNGLPQRRASVQNYYTSGYRSENSSLRRPTDSPTRSRALSASRSPNTLPAPNMYNHRRRMTANGAVLPPKSGGSVSMPISGARTPYEPMSVSNSPLISRRNSRLHQPSPPAYASPGNSEQSSTIPTLASGASPQRPKSKISTYTSPGPAPGMMTDNGLDTEWEETDSMSDAFSLAESFDNDSTASNRVFATANIAAFSESDSLYRDEHVPLNRAAQHTERISRLKQLRENRRIPLSLQRCPPTTSLPSTEAGAPPRSTPAAESNMVFGPYANDAHAQDFFNSGGSAGVPLPAPPSPLSVLSDVEEEGTEEEFVPKRAAARLVTLTQ